MNSIAPRLAVRGAVVSGRLSSPSRLVSVSPSLRQNPLALQAVTSGLDSPARRKSPTMQAIRLLVPQSDQDRHPARLRRDGRGAPPIRLQGPAPHHPGRRLAPIDLEARRQRPTVRRRQPEPQQQPLLPRRGVVLVGGAAVVDDVVVQQLDVARGEGRMQAGRLGDLAQQVQRLVLRRSQPRDARVLLRLLDEGAGILAGQLAVLQPEDRQGDEAADLLGLDIL